MILYDPSALLDFPRYGIEIPALDSRKTRTIAFLRSHPQLAVRESEWLYEGFDDTTKLEHLCRVHSRDYAQGFFDERAVDRLKSAFELVNPDGTYNRWNPESAESSLEELVPSLMKMDAGTWRTGKIALEEGFCHYMGGGAHHGHRDFGHGFCPVNDVAVAIRRLQSDGAVGRVWIIDVDAHKGDGSAAIFQDDDSVRTLSVHMASGWPLDGSLPRSHPSWTPSDIDIPIESGEERFYLNRLTEGLDRLAEFSRADMAFVLAGVDPWEGDILPSTHLLNLTMEQMNERDKLIYQFLESHGLPSAWVTAGGYGEESWRIHSAFLEWVLLRRLT